MNLRPKSDVLEKAAHQYTRVMSAGHEYKPLKALKMTTRLRKDNDLPRDYIQDLCSDVMRVTGNLINACHPIDVDNPNLQPSAFDVDEWVGHDDTYYTFQEQR